ncbi:keratin-associated protein 13-1-like [Camelus dromedarius]|uniref:Keratin-associated protein n=2 Tax=Camelus TaxID=9836 RepID=S9WC86_CAMFR|nr:keratin-associated protein 13-1 [Camelus ferus]XP_010954902.1 keratin-associated protein 13-1-like [Camelus bactrianus]XP_010975665.1 keratin-associated protein 13-1-like [Camelus dromedarius]EPY73549.1 keratin-associated protein 14 [Camelus ferus]
MSYNCCSGNFSSRSFRGQLRYPGSSCGSSYPSNLVYTTDLCSPSTCQQVSSLHSGCQEICSEPIRGQAFQVESSPCQSSCYRRRTSTLSRPCQTTYSGSLGFGSRGFQSFGCGFPSLGFGSSGFQSVGCGPRAFSSVRCRSSFDSPTYFSSRSCQSASFQPTFRSGFY